MNRFLDLAQFSRDEVVDLLALAQRLQDRPEPAALAGKILGLLFLNPSLRTLASFQAGMQRRVEEQQAEDLAGQCRRLRMVLQPLREREQVHDFVTRELGQVEEAVHEEVVSG